jgi:hypothetical protein
MNRKMQLLIVLIAVFGLTSYGIVNRRTSSRIVSVGQSMFKQNFSIGKIIEAHEKLLVEEPRTLSGMEAGSRDPFIQSQEHTTVQIKQKM